MILFFYRQCCFNRRNYCWSFINQLLPCWQKQNQIKLNDKCFGSTTFVFSSLSNAACLTTLIWLFKRVWDSVINKSLTNTSKACCHVRKDRRPSIPWIRHPKIPCFLSAWLQEKLKHPKYIPRSSVSAFGC